MSIIKSGTTSTTAYIVEANTNGDLQFQVGASATVALALNSSAQTEFPDGTAAAPAITNSGDPNTGIFFPAADTIAFAEGGVEAMRLDSSGNMGLGVTPSTWSTGKAIQINSVQASIWGAGDQINVISNAYYDGAYKYAASKAASMYEQALGVHTWSTAPSGTAGNNITFTQAMTLDASGNLGIGATTTTGGRLVITQSNVTQPAIYLPTDESTIQGPGTDTQIRMGGNLTVQSSNQTTINAKNASGVIVFGTGSTPTERARITSGGNLLVATTSYATGTAGTGFGAGADAGFCYHTRSGGEPLVVNRLTNDGTLVSLQQASVEEGTISVSGNTVSYNAFAGSHWSQLQDGSKPDILRGTVMESINELCVWPGESNERLPKSKISDTAGSKKVYGVFMAWDNDWTTTNDMYVTAVGAFICRVNGSVTVQEGDLLESNGDGTARVQADDIIRSSTIGKVTSTVKTHEYDDGSYCVPTVLYCG